MAVILNVQERYCCLKQELGKKIKNASKLSLSSVAWGVDFSANIYQAAQKRFAQELGITYHSVDLDPGISFQDFQAELSKLNNSPSVTGVILNKPFPSSWPEEKVFSCLREDKDPEGMHPFNIGKFFMNGSGLMPPTARSVKELLDMVLEGKPENYRGKKITFVGFSSIMAKPLLFWLATKLVTLSIANIATYEQGDLPAYVNSADIVISAVGKPGLIKGEWIKDNAVVIDVGISRENGKIVGDVEFAKAEKKASFITPVLGGVGKLTTLFLFDNLVKIAKTSQAVKVDL